MPKQTKAKIPSALIECVEVYAEAGYSTFNCYKDKKPAVSSWLEAQRDTAPNVMKYPYGMFGVKLKKDDLVIDLDPRNMGKRLVWSELKLRVSTLEDLQSSATIVRTAGGGSHIYLRKPEEFNIRKTLREFPGIDFLTEGCYVIGAGSNGYTFYSPPFSETHAPAGLLNLIRRKTVDLGEINDRGPNDSQSNIENFIRYIHKLAPVAIQGQKGDETTYKVACRGRDYNLSARKTLELMAKHYNPKCNPMWELRDLERKVSNAYVYNTQPAGTRDPEVVLPDLEGEDPNEWEKLLDWNKKDGVNTTPKITFNNIEVMLKNIIEIKDKFVYNAFNERLEIKGHVPWENNRINRYNAINDREIESIRLFISRKMKAQFTSNDMWKAVDLVAAANVYHPIKDVLEEYKWDGTPRIDTWLTKYCGAPDTELVRVMGRKVLLAMIARVYSPGCKFDYVLVLEGKQGIGKSTTCEILGGEWFGDAPIDPKDKDCIPYIHSKWVIELSEMITSRKTEADRLKNFISRREDDVRLPYARARNRFPRQCIFIGTINPDGVGYLNDPTGNRRFWPVHCTSFDLDGLKRDREQLLAEAVQEYKKGETLMLPHALQKEAEAEANERLSKDPWEWIISEYLQTQPDKTEITTQHIFCDILGGAKQKMTTGDLRRIADALKRLGWVRRKTIDGVKFIKAIKVGGNENS